MPKKEYPYNLILSHIHDSGHDSSRFELDGKIGMHRGGKKNPASIRCLTMLLRCLHESSTAPLRLMTAALRFTPAELRMLRMHPRFDTVLVRFKPIAPRPPPRTVFVMNRGELGWIGMNRGVSDTPIHPNAHEYTYGATKNEPGSATVELRLRPRPQSTTIRHESFKRFKIVALSWRFPIGQKSSRITTVLLRFTPMSLRCYSESCRCITI